MPPFISFANRWRKSYKGLSDDLKNANINENLIDSGIVEFISHVMLNRGFKSKRACVKDPDIVLYFSIFSKNLLSYTYNLSNKVQNTEYLHKIFPNAKIIYMVRDGRAAAYSHMVFVLILFYFITD